MATSSRSSFLSQSSSTPGRGNTSTFPSLSRGSSSIASQPVTPTWGPSPSIATSTETGLPSYKKKLSLSLASVSNSFEALASSSDDSIHPLFDTWNVWFSHRGANSNGGKNNKREETITAGGKESREDWEGGVVKLGGFSSVSFIS